MPSGVASDSCVFTIWELVFFSMQRDFIKLSRAASMPSTPSRLRKLRWAVSMTPFLSNFRAVKKTHWVRNRYYAFIFLCSITDLDNPSQKKRSSYIEHAAEGGEKQAIRRLTAEGCGHSLGGWMLRLLRHSRRLVFSLLVASFWKGSPF